MALALAVGIVAKGMMAGDDRRSGRKSLFSHGHTRGEGVAQDVVTVLKAGWVEEKSSRGKRARTG